MFFIDILPHFLDFGGLHLPVAAKLLFLALLRHCCSESFCLLPDGLLFDIAEGIDNPQVRVLPPE